MGGSEQRQGTFNADLARAHRIVSAPIPSQRTAGLYDPLNDRDSCGVGFVVNLRNQKSHKIIQSGLRLLANLEHRGAVGADHHTVLLAGQATAVLHQEAA